MASTLNGNAIAGKQVCEECGWHGREDELLWATSPFADEQISACPHCKTVESTRAACDERDCWDLVSCGTPTPNGYRSTCGKHRPQSARIREGGAPIANEAK